MRTDAHAIGEARSLAYHRRIADLLGHDASLRARAVLRGAAATRAGLAAAAADAWLELLSGDEQALRAVLGGDDERARWLRSCSPFASELPPKERWALWREAKAEVIAAAEKAHG